MKQVNLYSFEELSEESQKAAVKIFFKQNFTLLTSEEEVKEMLIDTGELFFENGHYSLRDF